MKIAIATCAAYPTLSKSNAVLRDSLAAQGVDVSVLQWNVHSFQDFAEPDLVLIRQTWDYQADPAGYAAWAHRAEALGARLDAPAATLIWNNDKRTLSELTALGVQIPKTAAVMPGDPPTLSVPLDTKKVVLKPAFGGSGNGVTLCDADDLLSGIRDLEQETPGRPIMAQEFLPEISGGEWKLTCIEGEVAFAMHALPQQGEFRINSRFKPTISRAEPPAAARAAAEKILTWLGQPLCARVDGVMRGDSFICTEIELTDPDLFLDQSPEAAQQLAAAAIARIQVG